jgi:quercetin dioxygenase-like cupin family protein
MATHHASPNEIVDLATWAQDVPNEKSKVIVKTDEMEFVRLVLLAGKEFTDHKVSGSCVIHCITGKIECAAMGTTQALTTGQLLYLMPGEPHNVKAVVDSVVLLTIIFKV